MTRARAGQRDAVDAVIVYAAPRVLAWCLRLGGPSVDPDDAAHDALLTAMERLHTLRDPARLDAWLYGIVRRTLAWHRRRGVWRRWTSGALEHIAAPSIAASDGARRFQAALEAVSARSREVLVLCVVEERSATEVAGMLGLPVGTVKSRLRKAKEELRKAAKRHHVPEAYGLEVA